MDRFDLRRVSYYFDHEDTGLTGSEECRLLYDAVAAWKQQWERHPLPFLKYTPTRDGIMIEDGRSGNRCMIEYTGPEAHLYEFLMDSRSESSIKTTFGSDSWTRAAISDFIDRGLAAKLDGRYLALALPG